MSGSEEKSLKPWDTPFGKKSSADLYSMIDGARVDNVWAVAKNWRDVHDELVGGEGDDGAGVQGKLAAAVKKVRETWHGKSAERFSQEAAKVVEDIARGGTFAKNVSETMVAAAEALETAMGEAAKVDRDPPAWGWPYTAYEKAIQDGNFDDPDLEAVSKMIGKDRYRRLGDAYKSIQADLARGLSAKQILATYHPDADGDLIQGEPCTGLWMPKFQRQALATAAALETLATSYKKQAGKLTPPEDIKGARPIDQRPSGGPTGGTSLPKGGLTGGSTPPSGLVSGGAPEGALGGPSGLHGPGWSPSDASPGASHGPGWSPGGGGPHTSPVSTGLDSFPGAGGASVADRGLPGGGYAGHGGGPVPTGGGSGGSGLAGGPPGVPGGLGLPGRPSGGPAPSSGSVARSAAGTRGATSGARTPGRGTGGPGMPGTAGAAGAGAGAGKGGLAGRGGALARKPGGAAGAPGGAAGGMAQGGSGLHRSRGGSQAGRSPAGRGAGAMGAPGANGAAAKKRSERTAQRQSYLVEDEETWTPRRNTVPRVIE
ncbi:WXG100 family type VII secretion target [Streptomyces chattanoogensis]|uniref:WXG100 family type VII secretion target n=1 Tax=Streptomyces chattanoogensis TaxID=66876 RepID=UPI0036BDCEE0